MTPLTALSSQAPACAGLDEADRCALITTSHGPVLVEVHEVEVERSGSAGRRPELAEGVVLREHALHLRTGDGACSFRGQVLEPFALALPELRAPLFPAGTPLTITLHDVLGEPETSLQELTAVLAPVHALAAELLVEPLTLHAERLHHAHRRLERYQHGDAGGSSWTFTFVAPRTLLEAELALLHLTSTGPGEHELRATSLALAPGWTGTASELLTSCREILT